MIISMDAVYTTPCYILDEEALRRNLEVLDGVQKRTGCKILLALKVFSMFSTFLMKETRCVRGSFTGLIRTPPG